MWAIVDAVDQGSKNEIAGISLAFPFYFPLDIYPGNRLSPLMLFLVFIVWGICLHNDCLNLYSHK